MKHCLKEDDSPIISQDMPDSGIHSIKGMESVVATVSGYHGTERFKVIKLISCTGANYVGAMDRSITHLVCWKFDGKKYDLARKLGTHIISHCWFEDCLKEGRRLQELHYSMQSGQEIRPILWKVPIIPDGIAKKCCPFFGERNVESNYHKTPRSLKGKEIDPASSNWSDSCLLKESNFHIRDTTKRLSSSQGQRNSRRALKKLCDRNENQIAVIDDPCNRPESSSHSSRRLRHRKSFHDEANSEVSTEPADESNCFEKTEPRDLKIIISAETRGRTEPGELKDDRRDCIALSSPCSLDQQTELSCAICWTDFCSLRGVLSCGHRFCYSCIQEWVDCMTARGKAPTCPLCKANITFITKIEESASSADQKIFSQTIPCNNRYHMFTASSSAEPVCLECQRREPEDLLLSCHICRSQRVHSCCLDPPLIPWTCIHCRDIRMLYQRFR